MSRLTLLVAALAAATLATACGAGAQPAQRTAQPGGTVVAHTAAGDTLHWQPDPGTPAVVVWLPRTDTTSAYLVQGARRAPLSPPWAKWFRKIVQIDNLERELAAKGALPREP